MATAVVMPKQGQTVESCIIVAWKKQPGDPVDEGETLCEVETDKALLEVESPAAGTVLALFFKEGDEVAVLTNIAAIGEPDEDVQALRPTGAGGDVSEKAAPSTSISTKPAETVEPVGGDGAAAGEAAAPQSTPGAGSRVWISPRARHLTRQENVDVTALRGSGPGGRIIERDVQAALADIPRMTPLAKSMVAQGDFATPAQGSGVSGRVMAKDLTPAAGAEIEAGEVQTIPLKGVRRVIAQRMLESLQTTAQLTLNASADARALLAYRQRLKQSAEALDLRNVTLNDLILFAVSRILTQYPELNALFTNDTIAQYKQVHLGVAVDTPRGLMVPVIRIANNLNLKQIAHEAKRFADTCLEGRVAPDDLTGGTFTVTNLGSFGIENFTPVLNPPQVAILGVGNINLKPVELKGEVQFIKHIGLSLTINHQVVDGAPAARFLQALSAGLADIDLLLAL